MGETDLDHEKRTSPYSNRQPPFRAFSFAGASLASHPRRPSGGFPSTRLSLIGEQGTVSWIQLRLLSYRFPYCPRPCLTIETMVPCCLQVQLWKRYSPWRPLFKDREIIQFGMIHSPHFPLIHGSSEMSLHDPLVHWREQKALSHWNFANSMTRHQQTLHPDLGRL